MDQYLIAEQWIALQGDGSDAEKTELMPVQAVGLGLKYPTEITVQRLVAIHSMASKGYTAAVGADPAVKLATDRSIKKRIKELAAMPAAAVEAHGGGRQVRIPQKLG